LGAGSLAVGHFSGVVAARFGLCAGFYSYVNKYVNCNTDNKNDIPLVRRLPRLVALFSPYELGFVSLWKFCDQHFMIL